MSAPFLDLIDLASERLGAAAVDCSDEFFAAKENLIKPSAPLWRESEYTERGKWMDGWETRRRRDDGDHDWCIIRLGVPGIVRGIDVDTAFFTGNFPESCAIDAGSFVGRRFSGVEILARSPLQGDSHNMFAVDSAPAATHLRLRIFPDGGVARLRAYGDVVADWNRLRVRGDVDLAAAEHGGAVVACSDMFFGSRHNLIMPGDATHMGDGWETKRRRGPGHDWTVIRLGAPGTVRRVEIDTRHFKGNAPGSCDLDAVAVGARFSGRPTSGEGEGGSGTEDNWQPLMPRAALEPHTRHVFEDNLLTIGDITHVRFNIYPDGGVGRLRLFGRPK